MHRLLILFSATFSAALVATLPPGLLNMSAAKISAEEGKRNGILFSVGVSIIIMVQACTALLIAEFLYKNPEVINIWLKIASGIFAVLALYFFATAQQKKTVRISSTNGRKKNSFFKGIFLATLNLLTLPYYSGINAAWQEMGWIAFKVVDMGTFAIASGAGTFSVLYAYTLYFNRLETKTHRFSKNSNYILGGLMLILLGITLIRILYH